MKERSKIWPSADPVLDEATDTIFDHLSRHIVCLNIEYVYLDAAGKQSEKEYFKTFSCFVVTLQHIWFLATAGHVLKEIDDLLAKKKIEILDCTIADYFGKNAPFLFTTPFPIQSVEKGYVYDQENVLDFALIYLSPLFQKGLEANKIVPITESQCVPMDHFAFTKFILLGFPESIVADFNKPILKGQRATYKLAPVLISAKRITDMGEIPDSIDLPTRDHAYFVGKLDTLSYPDIVGMSGGPIFGLIQEPSGELRYSVVAIQSGWFGKHGIITATPAIVFANIASEAVRMKMALGEVSPFE